MVKRIFKILFWLSLLSAVFLYFGNDLLIRFDDASPSTIITEDGIEKVRNAKRLPTNGPNFETYSRALSTIGRTHVHSQLIPVILGAYRDLEKSAPQVTWIYGESGWKNGWRFWPHRTHRNGLSVDFMVPVIDKQTGKSSTLSLWPWNAWGYQIRFDARGNQDSSRVDFAAIALHLHALQEFSTKFGVTIKRVIFDPPLFELLRQDPNFHLIANLSFMKNTAWFPHDSHYHVDFGIAS